MKSKTRTPRKRLREGRPLWADTPRITVRHRNVLPQDICDIAVVGAGVTGAVTALLLAQEGFQVAVLDRRTPLTGSTLASTAIISFEIDTPLTMLAKKIGPRKAARAYKRSYLSVRRLHRLVGDLDIDCGWEPQNGLYLAGDTIGARGLAAEARRRQAIGIPSLFLDAQTLKSKFGLDRTGAIESKGNAICNPAQLAAGILREAVRLGARIYSPHDVTDIISGDDCVVLCLKDGHFLRARRAIFATGYEPLGHIPKHRYEIVSTWALATPPGTADNRFSRHFWEGSDPYLYVRADARGRIIAGGEDAAFSSPRKRARMTKAKTRRILSKISKLFGLENLKMEYTWSGSFASSPTGLPYIAPIADEPNCFAILGCGGNGITYAMIAAEIARAWACGRTDKDADLFN